MKTKNKKILTRLSAVLATCLLLVAFAVPCLAEETDPTEQSQYVITEKTFDDYDSFYDYLAEDFTRVQYIVVDVGTTVIVFRPTTHMFVTYSFASDVISIIDTTITFNYYFCANENSALLIQKRGDFIDSAEVPTESFATLNARVFVIEPAELTPVPVDPDAPTRTGLYGELYLIIRDAIYGDNALLDSTQEFTLTQIATWMTYIVILLPFVVIAIILFKIFVR